MEFARSADRNTGAGETAATEATEATEATAKDTAAIESIAINVFVAFRDGRAFGGESGEWITTLESVFPASTGPGTVGEDFLAAGNVDGEAADGPSNRNREISSRGEPADGVSGLRALHSSAARKTRPIPALKPQRRQIPHRIEAVGFIAISGLTDPRGVLTGSRRVLTLLPGALT